MRSLIRVHTALGVNDKKEVKATGEDCEKHDFWRECATAYITKFLHNLFTHGSLVVGGPCTPTGGSP